MTTRSGWFTVDTEGLRSLADRRPPGWWLHELIQNGLDEDGCTEVRVQLDPFPGGRRDAIHVIVTDNAPAGWEDLAHASTMFARSKKADDPEKRGRFNVGEKLFLSICEKATIRTTTGTMHFLSGGRKRMTLDTISVGTIIEATVLVDRAWISDLVTAALMVIAPRGVKVIVNGSSRERLGMIGGASGVLPTEFDQGDGSIRSTRRLTEVEVYEVPDGEEPTIFEMGIPVCGHGGAHHLNVLQVVPLGIERMAVTPRYLERLYGIALDAIADELTQEEAEATWVTQGLPDAEPEAVAAAVTARFGEGAVSLNPRAPESNQEAMDAGRTVIPPRALPRRGWEAVRAAREVSPDLAVPSSQAFPTGVASHPDGQEAIPEADWSTQMWQVADYARSMALHCLGRDDLRVRFHNLDNGKSAWWRRGGEPIEGPIGTLGNRPELTVNLHGMAGRMVEALDRDALDGLLVHEMGHELESNHLSHAFHDALCKIAVRLRSFEGRL